MSTVDSAVAPVNTDLPSAEESAPTPVVILDAAKDPQGLTGKIAQKNRNVIADIVGLLVAKYRDEGKRNLAIGKKSHEHLVWQISNFPNFGAGDFDTTCKRIAEEVRVQVPIRSVRCDNYVREYVFVELLRPLVGDKIDKLSYHYLPKMAPTIMAFSKATATGVIKEGWHDWLSETVERQTGSAPQSVNEVTDSMKAREKAIAIAKQPVLTEEQIQDIERKAARADRVKRENDANTALTSALDEALGGLIEPRRVAGIVDQVFSDRKIPLPANIQAMASMSPGDARLLIDLMLQAGNISALGAMDHKLREIMPIIAGQMTPLAIAS